ncbi:hypothetical protein GCM10009844_38580 [Nocardioides koreensis]|uniref:DUF998 domain-containing protein n=1 Tax=Nocardioides koreensis TaxID=433651 RepID=A0ABN3A4H7_9ACTN
MDDTRLAQVGGACAVVGGCAWTAASIMHASQPRGCVGSECDYLPMRSASTGTAVLVALAAAMMIACGTTLMLLVRRRNELGRTGVLGAAACGFGIGALALAAGVQALAYDGDFPWMPAFVGPGVAALVVGLALVAWTVLRSRVVPTWAGIGLLIGAVLLLGTNEQTTAVLLAVPFGVAWLATGAALLLRRPEGAPAAPGPAVRA